MASVTIIEPKRTDLCKKKIGVYVRVSTDSTDQQNSYTAQIGYYTELVKKHPEWILTDIYADEGISGMSLDRRDEFYRMMHDARRGKLDEILVKSISRFARNTRDCLAALRELKDIGVTVKAEKENIDTGTLTTELMVSVSGSLAQEESVSMSQNMKWSYQKRMQSGQYITSNPPFGYRLENGKHMVIETSEADVVKWIFDSYLDGMNVYEIAEAVTAMGFPTSEGRPNWQSSTVQYLLQNEKYIGDSLNQKSFTTDTFPFRELDNKGQRPQYYVSGTHPAIIDKDTFERTQKLMRSRSSKKLEPWKEYPLSRRIHCGNCGTTFMRRKTTNGIIAWACRKHEDGKDKCGVGRVPETEIYTAFTRMCRKLQINLDIVISPAIRQMSELSASVNRSNPAILEISKAIMKASDQLLLLTGMKNRGVINTEMYVKKNTAVTVQLADLKRQRRLLIEADDNDSNTIEQLRELQRIIRSATLADQFDEELFSSIVDDVLVDSQQSIRFRLIGGLELQEPIKGKMR